jgi:hypothetical protein
MDFATQTQIGLRTATVMEQSPLPLSTWFRAIISLLQEPLITLRQLQARLGLRRWATVRGIQTRIVAALASDQADRLLAELPALVRHGAAPELGGAYLGFLQNGSSDSAKP